MMKKYFGSMLCGAILLSGAALAQAPVAPINCMITPWREARLAFDQPGIVAERLVARNDRVKAGDVLLTLQAGLAEIDLERANVTLAALKQRLKRSKTLTQNNVISRDEIEKLQSEYDLAVVEVAAVEARLDKMRLLAPFDGVITGTAVEAGDLTGSAPLITLAEIERLKAVVILPVEAWATYALGEKLMLREEVSGESRVGEIIGIDRFIDASANSFSMEVSLHNADFALLPGAACQILSRAE